METTRIKVETERITPKRVRKVRSLWARKVSKAMSKGSFRETLCGELRCGCIEPAPLGPTTGYYRVSRRRARPRACLLESTLISQVEKTQIGPVWETQIGTKSSL